MEQNPQTMLQDSLTSEYYYEVWAKKCKIMRSLREDAYGCFLFKK